jgi:uncharacterized membrane protein YkoI
MMGDMTTTTKTRSLAAAAALALTLTVSACGDGGTTQADGVSAEQPVGAEGTEDDTAAEGTTDDASTDDAVGTGDGPATAGDPTDAVDLNTIALLAIDTAETETGGIAYEIDDQDDDGTWEVDVRVQDRSVEVTVSADGLNALGTEDDDLDGDDRAGLDAAGISLADAIEIAIAEVDGQLDDAELSEDDGRHYWEVSMDTVDRDDVEVKVDVTDGTVIEVD